MRLTYKYRLFPTSAQRTSLEKTLGACRWLYNKTLETRKNAWEQEQRSISRYDTISMILQWKAENPSLIGVHSQVLQEVCTRVDLAFQAFFRRVKAGEEKVGYPRFRGRNRYDSFTFPQSGFKLVGNQLTLSKIGAVKVELHRPICGKVKTLTVRRDAIGNWYACFSCECDIQPLSPVAKVVGVDLGLSTFAYLSNGEKIARQRWMKQDERDIARLQRKKELFAKGSPERRKVVHALCHAYARAANRRRDFAHQESRKLVNEYQFIALENLDIRDMQVNGNKVISRGIADVAWGQFVQFTAYKAANAGRLVVLVNPKGTTQMCSGCSAIVPKDLSIRIHDCPHCGLKLNRDHNAALNILARGLASMGTQSLEAPDFSRGE
ncbi:MAG: transposase [Caldilineaceae bacterium]